MKIAMVVALSTAACSSSSPPVPAKPPGEGVELVDPGALPHRPLRYHVAKGTASLLELAMDLDFALGPRGGPMPTVVMQMEIRADDRLADGSARIRTRIASARARERPNTAITTDVMSAQAAPLTGLELTATLAPRGTLSDSRVASGKDLPPALAGQLAQLNSSLEHVAMPLPEEPVGVGAKWRNRTTVVQNSVRMMTVTTIEVVAIDGDRVTFKSTSEVAGDDQQVEVDGMKAKITKIGGSGSNSGVLDLGRMVMTGEFGADFHFDIASDGNTAGMSMRVATRLKPLETIEAASEPAKTPAQPAAKAPPEPPESHEPATKAKPTKTAVKPADDPS